VKIADFHRWDTSSAVQVQPTVAVKILKIQIAYIPYAFKERLVLDFLIRLFFIVSQCAFIIGWRNVLCERQRRHSKRWKVKGERFYPHKGMWIKQLTDNIGSLKFAGRAYALHRLFVRLVTARMSALRAFIVYFPRRVVPNVSRRRCVRCCTSTGDLSQTATDERQGVTGGRTLPTFSREETRSH